MDNFEEKIGKFFNTKWYIHFITFFSIFFIISLIMLYGFTDNPTGQAFKYSCFIGLFFGLTITGLFWIGNQANIFFREADKIEEMIRDNKPQSDVIKFLYELKDKSFHRQTGSRLNELAKMAEIKYNITLLKK